MKKQYDTKLRKQRRILLDQVKDYYGDNVFIKELSDNLKKQVETPIMVQSPKKGQSPKGQLLKTLRKERVKRTARKNKRSRKKLKHPEEGVYSVIDFLSN